MDEYCDGNVCWGCCVVNFDQLGRLKARHVMRGKSEGSTRRDGEERL